MSELRKKFGAWLTENLTGEFECLRWRGAPGDGRRAPPGDDVRRLRVLAGLRPVPLRRLGRGRGGVGLAEGLHDANRPRYCRRQSEST